MQEYNSHEFVAFSVILIFFFSISLRFHVRKNANNKFCRAFLCKRRMNEKENKNIDRIKNANEWRKMRFLLDNQNSIR